MERKVKEKLRLAFWLEIIPGALIQTFGIGHIAAGNYITGVLFMLGYWFVASPSSQKNLGY